MTAGLVVVVAALTAGTYLSRVVSTAVASMVATVPLRAGAAVLEPIAELRRLARQQVVATHPADGVLRSLAPAGFVGLAAAILSFTPAGPGSVVADVRTSIVVVGAAEALVIVVVFAHGWAPDSVLPLQSAYRFVAVALSFELLSMFVLIAAALPARSLSLVAVVESQRHLWNVVRQPLGLPLWIVVMLGVTFRGPLGVVDSADLAGGGGAEDSGARRAAWTVGRHAVLVALAVLGADVFLGGWLGPVLPGAAWVASKALLLVVLVEWAAATLARWPVQRIVRTCWTMLLPVAFAHLALAGVVAL